LKKAGIQFDWNVKLDKENMDQIKLEKVTSNFSGLKIKTKHTKHQIIDKIATTLFLPTIKSQIEKSIDVKLYEKINNDLCKKKSTKLLRTKEMKRKKKQKTMMIIMRKIQINK
jgi:hypothetical protein